MGCQRLLSNKRYFPVGDWRHCQGGVNQILVVDLTFAGYASLQPTSRLIADFHEAKDVREK